MTQQTINEKVQPMTRHPIIFVSSSIQQPRHQKRIASLEKRFSVFVIHNRRDLYSENADCFVHPKDQQLHLGVVANRAYHKRIDLLLKLYRAIRSRPENLVYCTSVESVMAAIFAGKKVIHELGDMHQFGAFRIAYRALDSFIVPKLEAMFITSPWFISEYYAKSFPSQEQKFHLLENRMSATMKNTITNYRRRLKSGLESDRKIRLGAIGSLRYPRMVRAIRDLILNRQDIEFHIHGDFDGDTNIFTDTPRSFYHGVFKNPKDLEEIYSNIDIVVILYDDLDQNVRWALPNKLYEAIAFAKPILCSENCCLASIVTSKDYGVSSNIEKLSASVDDLVANYDKYQFNMLAQSDSAYLNDDEFLSIVSNIASTTE